MPQSACVSSGRIASARAGSPASCRSIRYVPTARPNSGRFPPGQLAVIGSVTSHGAESGSIHTGRSATGLVDVPRHRIEGVVTLIRPVVLACEILNRTPKNPLVVQ